MAFAQAYEVFGWENAKHAAICLGNFLMRIQCHDESPLWDGAWRGAYSVKNKCWAGRANQNNLIDEGGMFAVYTGWCAAPIMYGLLMIENFKE